MARPLRIEYPGAWYHVMNRGANKKQIFLADSHRKLFLSLLEEITKLFDVEIHTYALMGNHYHLLLKTNYANLGKAMKHLSGVYTQKFNQVEKRDGPLFRGRYKAILVQDDLYRLQVSRYIHLNPFVAKLCEAPEEYLWSSYQIYLGKASASFIQTESILQEIGGKKNYINFIQQGVDAELEKFYGKSVTPTILGSKEFKKITLENIRKAHLESSPADTKRIKAEPPTLHTITKQLASYYNINIESLIIQSHRKSIPQIMTICASKYIGQHSNKTIAKYFNITTDAVRGIIRNYTKLFEANPSLIELLTQL